MIHLIRPGAPRYLSKKNIRPHFERMEAFFSRMRKSRLQERFDFDQRFLVRAKADLARIFHSKCAYCEVALKPGGGDLESFRPRRLAMNLNAETSDDHYWWLHFEWRNMYYTCTECNRFKANWFPVKGKRAKIKAPYEVVIQEKSLLIDPCIDQPHEHLEFTMDGKVKGKTEKGQVTIDILKLNRSDLVRSRRKAMAVFAKDIEYVVHNDYAGLHGSKKIEFDDAMRNILSAIRDNPYGIFRGAFRSLILAEWEKDKVFKDVLRRFLANIKFKSRFYDIMRGAPKDLVKYYPEREIIRKGPSRRTGPFVIEKIAIRNFRMIDELTIDFPGASKQNNDDETKHIQEPWLMLLGENGVGKSSILQAIALVLMGKSYLRKFNPEIADFLKYGATEGYIRVFEFGNDVPYSIEFSELTGRVKSSVATPPVNLLGYGSIRLFPTPEHHCERNRGMVRVMNLFDPHMPLTDSSKWLVEQYKLGKKNREHGLQFERIALALKDLLMLNENEHIGVDDDSAIIFQASGNHIPVAVMSEGYKSVLSVVVDIMHVINKINTTMETAQGIVLLDEIGTHLHPRWRMQVVNRLRKVFPKMQFIATTHDPLCLRGLKKDEVIVLRKTPEGKVYRLADLPDPAGLNAEQLLGSEFFGLSSTYEPEDEQKLNEYHFLLTKTTLTKAEEKRKRSLEAFVKKKNKIGDNLYEQALHEVVQQKVAETKFQTPETKIELNKSTLDKIKSIWESVES